MFATLHPETTILLMELMEETGLKTYVGKVNMDRNSPDYLREKTPLEAERHQKLGGKHPAQIPECTPDLNAPVYPFLYGRSYEAAVSDSEGLPAPLQSHLSENLGKLNG